MPNDEPSPEWVISSCCRPSSLDSDSQNKFLLAARRVWPYVRASARRELAERQHDPENATLAAEVWEGVLQSVARSLHRLRVSWAEITNIDSYLMGAFWHRFNRVRRRQRRREQTLRLVASVSELDDLAKKRGLHVSADFERRILTKEVLGLMDLWMKRVWTARQYGYSWKEISLYLGMGEGRTKMRFRYKLSKLRERLGRGQVDSEL